MSNATLTPAQLHAIGEMQHSLSHAARELKFVQHLALEHNVNFAGLNLDPLRAAYADLCAQVLEHMRAIPEQRRAALAIFHAPRVKAAA